MRLNARLNARLLLLVLLLLGVGGRLGYDAALWVSRAAVQQYELRDDCRAYPGSDETVVESCATHAEHHPVAHVWRALPPLAPLVWQAVAVRYTLPLLLALCLLVLECGGAWRRRAKFWADERLRRIALCRQELAERLTPPEELPDNVAALSTSLALEGEEEVDDVAVLRHALK